MKKKIITILFMLIMFSVFASEGDTQFYCEKKLEYPNSDVNTLYTLVKDWVTERPDTIVKLKNCNQVTAKVFCSTKFESQLAGATDKQEIVIGIIITNNIIEIKFNSTILNTENSGVQEVEFLTQCSIITNELKNFIFIETI